MDPYCLKKLNIERRARRAALLLTDLGDGRDRVIREGDPVAGQLGEVIAKAFLSGQSGVAAVDGRCSRRSAGTASCARGNGIRCSSQRRRRRLVGRS